MSNSTIDLLLSHRSIRRFENRPLPDGVLETLIRCGQQASTSSNLQAYTVIHVADPQRKKRLAETVRRSGADTPERGVSGLLRGFAPGQDGQPDARGTSGSTGTMRRH